MKINVDGDNTKEKVDKNKIYKLKNDKIAILIILLFSAILSTIFMFNKTIYNGVDTSYHMSRIIGIANSWRSGNIMAYIHLDTTGYGYAMGFFYSNLFMIIPSLMYFLGMNIIIVYKIFLFTCSICTAISMYLCSKKITKSRYSGLVSAVLYTTCGYRIITLVLKSFVGELLGFIFIPIIIYGLYELLFEDEKKWWVFSIGFVCLLNSNLVMTEIMLIIVALIVICNIRAIIKDKKRLVGLIKSVGFALVISAIFWMPLMEQLCKSTFEMFDTMKMYKPTNWLLEFENLFWGTAQYKKNYAAAYGLGIIFIILLIPRVKIKEKSNITKFCDISILVGLLLILSLTNFFPWKYLNKIGETIQFPSRLEIPIAAFFSIACGIICYYITKDSKKLKIILLIGIIIWQTIFSIICLKSCISALMKYNTAKSDDEIFLSEDFEYDLCDEIYLPDGGLYFDAKINAKEANKQDGTEPLAATSNPVEINISKQESTLDIYKYYGLDNINILKKINETNESYTTNDKNLLYSANKRGLSIELSYTNNTKEDTYIEVPMYYYYGYVAKSSSTGEKYKIEKGDKGVIRIYLGDSKADTMKIYYGMTNIQKISIIITIITIVATISYIIVKKVKAR